MQVDVAWGPAGPLFDRESRRDDPDAWSAVSAKGMVASAHYLATAAGAEMLSRGGNAVDAAVACSLALGVVEPAASGLGGMALGLVHLASQGGRTFSVEGPCRAPRAASPERLVGERRYRGYRAVAVPTHVRVVDHLQSRYGRLGVAEVIRPAIKLAEHGAPITRYLHRLIAKYRGVVRRSSLASRLLGPEGEPLPAGATLVQPELARTLRRLADAGFDDFYRGAIAEQLDADMARHGGFVCRADLAEVPAPREARPLRARWGERRVLTLGPPGGGSALVQLLQMLASRPGGIHLDRPRDAVRLAAMIRRARLDRRRLTAAFGAEDLGEAGEIVDPSYCRRVMAELEAEVGGTPGETTHLVTADAEGNVVSVTQSIERSFGAAVASEELGFLYNGFLKAFKLEGSDHPHYLRPGAVARSNASPTIVLDAEGRAFCALGCTGSERSVSAIFETLVRLTSQPPFEAVAGPRLHCTPEGGVWLEAERFEVAILAALEAAGFELVHLEPYAFKTGGLQLVVRQSSGWCGVADPRRDGWASGPRSAEADGHGWAAPSAV